MESVFKTIKFIPTTNIDYDRIFQSLFTATNTKILLQLQTTLTYFATVKNSSTGFTYFATVKNSSTGLPMFFQLTAQYSSKVRLFTTQCSEIEKRKQVKKPVTERGENMAALR